MKKCFVWLLFLLDEACNVVQGDGSGGTGLFLSYTYCGFHSDASLSDSVFLSPPGLEASEALFRIARLTQAFTETDERGLKGTRAILEKPSLLNIKAT